MTNPDECWCVHKHAPVLAEKWASKVWVPLFVAVHLYSHLNMSELSWWIRVGVLTASYGPDRLVWRETLVKHDEVPKTVAEMVERRRAAHAVDLLTRSSA